MLAAGAGEDAGFAGVLAAGAGCADAVEAEEDFAEEEAMPSAVTAGIGGVGKSGPD